MPRTDKNSEYMSNGIAISPAVPTAGERVQVLYDGLLAKSGATDIYVRVGFGSRWENQYDYKMVRTGTAFETTVPVTASDTMNVCFKDCANHWDNNSGRNYSFDVNQ